jgi:hypothetical protein
MLVSTRRAGLSYQDVVARDDRPAAAHGAQGLKCGNLLETLSNNGLPRILFPPFRGRGRI